MIKLNDKKMELSLVAIKDNSTNKLISSTNGAITLISEENKFYLTLNKGCIFKTIKKSLSSFVKSNKYDINICLDSFINLLSDPKDEIKLFNTIVEVISFASHKQVSLKKDADKKEERIYNLESSKDFSTQLEKELIKTSYINFARDLQDTPPNLGTGTVLANKIVEKAKTIPGIKITVLGRKEAERLGMGLFLGVNAGSPVEAQAVILEYTSDESLPKTALVGKGITFDSGGYNLKPSAFMEGMKFDMSGAAIMLSTIMALAESKAKANVVGIGMFTDNRIGQNATLPESVLTSMNGLTVEINNTDAEGRLVLADGITYVIREKKADRIIETSTLTGAIVVALGPWAIGAFTTNDQLWNEVSEVSEFTGERMWRLPIFDEHLEVMQKASDIADLSNAEKGRNAGSSTAAAFLNAFAEEKPYLHLDIAGTADDGKRGSAILVSTLFELLNK